MGQVAQVEDDHRHMRGPSGLLTGISRFDDIEVYWIDHCSALQNTREAPANRATWRRSRRTSPSVRSSPRTGPKGTLAAWCQAELLMGYALSLWATSCSSCLAASSTQKPGHFAAAPDAQPQPRAADERGGPAAVAALTEGAALAGLHVRADLRAELRGRLLDWKCQLLVRLQRTHLRPVLRAPGVRACA